VRARAVQTELPAKQLVAWIGISASKFFDWRRRYGKVNEHNALVPRDHWLEDWEKQAILDFYQSHPDDGYRRVTYMMMDADVVAASPSTVYRVLSQANVLRRWEVKPSKKGKGFVQPLAAHAHWHIDISYVNLSGTFYYLCSLLDGYSRYIVHHEIRERMTEQDVEIIVQRALEKFPGVKPRIISDNSPQFLAKDCPEMSRRCTLSFTTHTICVRTLTPGSLLSWDPRLPLERGLRSPRCSARASVGDPLREPDRHTD